MVPAESGVEGRVSSVVEKGTFVLHQFRPGKYFMGLSTIGADGQRRVRGVNKGHLPSPLAPEFLTASAKACQAQELVWCWLGSCWL